MINDSNEPWVKMLSGVFGKLGDLKVYPNHVMVIGKLYNSFKELANEFNGKSDRPDKKNIIQDSPNEAEKAMPELPTKAIRIEGERESKNNKDVNGFES